MSSQALPERVEIRERAEKTLTDCPPEIGKQLQRAAFDKISASEYEKTRQTQGDGEERAIITAEIRGNALHLSVQDVVGVIDLTPTSKLQINPKIGWSDILEMFLSVRQANRSLEYQGVPIKEFLADDVSIQDVFVVIAVNYLNALEPIHRHGFTRRFNTHRYDAVTGRGRIDIEKSIMNLERGQPKQHYVKKEIEYTTPENQLIYAAGQRLLHLFQNADEQFRHQQFYTIFSEVREVVHDLEARGISVTDLTLADAQQLDSGMLPRQRGYYHDAIKTAKTILSSTTGESLASGSEELTVDFILNMEHLFEQFTQVALESELRKLSESPLYESFDSASIADEPTVQVYDDASTANYRPDHIFQIDDEPVVVMDSKYYGRGNDPSLEADTRSRMFSYGYILGVDHLAFCCPFGESQRRRIPDRDVVVDILRPGGDFDIDAYRRMLRDFLKQTVSGGSGDTEGFRNALDETICHPTANAETVEDVIYDDAFRPDGNRSEFARRKILDAAIDQSNLVRGRRDLESYASVSRKLKGPLREYDEYNVVVPIFESDSDEIPEKHYGEKDPDSLGTHEAVKYYFLKIEDRKAVDITGPEYLILEWG